MTNVEGVPVPEWDLADRLIKARRVARVRQTEMAAELGVSRQAISLFETGEVSPRLAYIRIWAIRCGVPLDWLRYGTVTPPNNGDEQPEHESWCIHTDAVLSEAA